MIRYLITVQSNFHHREGDGSKLTKNNIVDTYARASWKGKEKKKIWSSAVKTMNIIVTLTSVSDEQKGIERQGLLPSSPLLSSPLLYIPLLSLSLVSSSFLSSHLLSISVIAKDGRVYVTLSMFPFTLPYNIEVSYEFSYNSIALRSFILFPFHTINALDIRTYPL